MHYYNDLPPCGIIVSGKTHVSRSTTTNSMSKLPAMFTVIFLLMLVQCKSTEPDNQSVNCDCQSPTEAKEQKNVEAVVVLVQYARDHDMYILSTYPPDFESTSHGAGDNILVPCDELLSVPAEFRTPGLRVMVSYKRKTCYGAITSPVMRVLYGYYVELASIKLKP